MKIVNIIDITKFSFDVFKIISFLKRDNEKIILLIRSKISLYIFKFLYLNIYDYEIYYAEDNLEIEKFLYKYNNYSLKIYYFNNYYKNSKLLRFNFLYHIYINFSKTDIKKSFRAYDEVWITNKKLYQKSVSVYFLKELKLIKVNL